MRRTAGDVTGTLNGVQVRLAAWEPAENYQRRYEKVELRRDDVPAERELRAVERDTVMWVVDSWASGEGETWWRPERPEAYNTSVGVRPTPVGDGIQLGPFTEETELGGGGGPFVGGAVLGYGQGTLWTGAGSTVWSWNPSTVKWSQTSHPTGGSGDITSFADPGDGWVYMGGFTNNVIRRVDGGGAQGSWYGTGTGDDFARAPVVCAFNGQLFALDGDRLYRIDGQNTRTLVADVRGSSSQWLTNPHKGERLNVSDRGPIWLQSQDNGQTYVWEYNVADDTAQIVARLPVDYATPYSVYFALGFYWVSFRYAARHSDPGDGYVYAARGAQSVVVPFPAPAAGTANRPVLIGGVVGSELVVYYGGRVYAYDYAEGAVFQLGKVEGSTGSAQPVSVRVFGRDIFLSPVSTNRVERFDQASYSTTPGTLRSGRFGFGVPGVPKTLMDVTVVTDPLPGLTDVTLKVSADGGPFTAVSGVHEVNDATSFTFDVTTGAGKVEGYTFEFELTLTTTSSAVSPVVRQVIATARGGAHRLRWRLLLDVDDDNSVNGQFGYQMLDFLHSTVRAGGVVVFEDPWQNRESLDTFEVTVESVVAPSALQDNPRLAVVELLSRGFA